MCAPLEDFIESVKPGQKRSIEFHTIWGGQFKDSPKSDAGLGMYEKRCELHGYEPARPICQFLAEDGAAEFSGENAKRALSCLSPGTRFGHMMQLEIGTFSFHYGSENRGSNIDLIYKEDRDVGGMVLVIAAVGY